MSDRSAALVAARDTAALVATDAARLLIGHFHVTPEIHEKGERDLVSDADRLAERLIVHRLGQVFPDDVVVGEEGAGADRDRAGRRRWYVDPIDGTSNFLKGLPAWGVSIGLCDADDSLLAGAIVLPRLGETFTAHRGGGAYRNGVAIRASDEERLDRCLVAYSHTRSTGTAWGGLTRQREGFVTLSGATLGSRMHGCAVADLTAIASGRIDVLWAGGLQPWDVAAGLLIALEAGATVTDPHGAPVRTPVGSFLASPAVLHDFLGTTLRP